MHHATLPDGTAIAPGTPNSKSNRPHLNETSAHLNPGSGSQNLDPGANIAPGPSNSGAAALNPPLELQNADTALQTAGHDATTPTKVVKSAGSARSSGTNVVPEIPQPTYDFWPRPPYAEDPNVFIPSQFLKNKKYKFYEGHIDDWLWTVPLENVDHQRWHGVKLLGRGGYGIAGLWTRTDQTNQIIDVSHRI